jgi:predicted NAD/FAD-binding protein
MLKERSEFRFGNPNQSGLRLAIVGSGISGLVAAYLLSSKHDVTVFEANDYVGGHTRTIKVELDGECHHVDTGFIVYNELNYPNFTKLLDLLRVKTQVSNMSFSVHCERTGLEYNGTSLNSLYVQRRNLFRPAFHRMVLDIIRFYRKAPRLLENPEGPTLGEFLDQEGFSHEFINWHILPMGAAIWSSGTEKVRDFPARYFVEFFKNHGFLKIRNRPVWRTISGGSSTYIAPLTRKFENSVRTSCPVVSVKRKSDSVLVTSKCGGTECFDNVIIASHSDQALAMLSDPSPVESSVLGSIKYQRNATLLHTDSSLMPKRKRAWASWNYRIPANAGDLPTVTYHMNYLQGISSRIPFCVTLNASSGIDSNKVLARMVYEHPVYKSQTVKAQERWAEINGSNRTFFCGAYWGHGFHEDGVKSALRVCGLFGRSL